MKILKYLFIKILEANILKDSNLNFVIFFTDNMIELSTILSKNYLIHNINNFYEEFDSRIYDNLEHRNLYVLSLDCDYAPDVLRQVKFAKKFLSKFIKRKMKNVFKSYITNFHYL